MFTIITIFTTIIMIFDELLYHIYSYNETIQLIIIILLRFRIITTIVNNDNNNKTIVANHCGVVTDMLGFYTVSECKGKAEPTAPPVHVRRYYIAAEEVLWDYAPGGLNLFNNRPLNESGRYHHANHHRLALKLVSFSY